jgi:hypothetical protein
MRSPRRHFLALALGIALAPAALAAAAGSDEAKPYGDLSGDRFWLSIGAYLPSFATDAQANSDQALVPGASLSLEDDLGLDSSASNGRFDFVWRIAPRHALAARYFAFNRTATTKLGADIQYGDTDYLADSVVDSEFDLTYAGLAYRWSFTQRDGLDVFLIGGLDYVGLSGKLSGQGVVYQGGISVGTFDETTKESIGLPVPVVGIGLAVEVTHHLFLREEFELFGLKVQDINGSLVDNRLSLDWYPFQHFGFGLGYNSIRLRVEDNGSGTSGRFLYEIRGARIYLTGMF